jgi:integrase
MINLATVESRTQEQAAGATLSDQATLKGLIVKYMAYLEKEGRCSDIEYPKIIMRLSQRGANLQDPESVKATIMKQPWKNGTKILAIYAYDALAKMLHLQWTPPKLRQEEQLPWIPLEKELDMLITSCQSKSMATYLQALKETFADPGEVLRLEWLDIDSSNNSVAINHPVKGHNPRQLRVSNQLIAMFNALPRKSDRVFPRNYRSVSDSYRHMRNKAAYRFKNPRLQSIMLKTFRHWGATMTYHYTRDILLVKKLLGHKRIENTMKYTQLVSFKDNEFDVATATTIEEAKQLAAAGFEKFDELQGIHIYRRPKRFGGDSGINAADKGINL